MILGPLLLEFGLIPLVSSATSSYMTLLTSVSPFLQYLSLNRIPLHYAALLSGIGIFASLAGQLLVVSYIKRSGRHSLIAFAIAAINVTATFMLVGVGSVNIIHDVRSGEHLGFKELCGR
jgi:uncharacterized membrane protein YfcA